MLTLYNVLWPQISSPSEFRKAMIGVHWSFPYFKKLKIAFTKLKSTFKNAITPSVLLHGSVTLSGMHLKKTLRKQNSCICNRNTV